jgi:hypothetical protein
MNQRGASTSRMQEAAWIDFNFPPEFVNTHDTIIDILRLISRKKTRNLYLRRRKWFAPVLKKSSEQHSVLMTSGLTQPPGDYSVMKATELGYEQTAPL